MNLKANQQKLSNLKKRGGKNLKKKHEEKRIEPQKLGRQYEKGDILKSQTEKTQVKTLFEGINDRKLHQFSERQQFIDLKGSRKPEQNKYKETILRHIIVKLKIKDKEKILKAAGGKRPINRKQKSNYYHLMRNY